MKKIKNDIFKVIIWLIIVIPSHILIYVIFEDYVAEDSFFLKLIIGLLIGFVTAIIVSKIKLENKN